MVAGPVNQHFAANRAVGPYIADFFCAKAGLVVEVDGLCHTWEEARAHDARRDAYMRGQGLRVLRIPAREVFDDPDGIAERLKRLAFRMAEAKSRT